MLVIDLIYFVGLFVTAYFTFFYLILWLENKNSLRGSPKKIKLPSVSFVIPAYNEGSVIKKTIKNLLSINYPKDKFEILAVDDGSSDNTYNILKGFGNKVVALRKNRGGKSSALNFGISHAKNEYVAVLDADTSLEKNALMNVMGYFDEKNIVAVTSRIISKSDNSLLEKFQNMEYMVAALTRKVKEKLNLIEVAPGAFSVFKKNVLTKLGGFDENNIWEDGEIAWRLLKNGYKIKMAYNAVAYTIYPKLLKNWWRQRTRWYVGGLQTFTKYFNCIGKRDTYAVGTFIIPTWIMNYGTFFLFIFLSPTVPSTSWLKTFFMSANRLQWAVRKYFLKLFTLTYSPFMEYSFLPLQ